MNNHDMQDSAIAAPAAGGLGGAGSAMLRIGVFLDGGFLQFVSDHYKYHHEREARLSIRGLHEFVRDEVSRCEGVEKRRCQVVDAHWFRGRYSADQARTKAEDFLYHERQFDDVLIREGVTMHVLPLAPDHEKIGGVKEKGVDVWFALEAYEMAVLKRFDICVIVAGDRDFVPLARKLATLGSRVMLLAWNLDNGKTKTSSALIDEVTYPVLMHKLIENPPAERKEIIDGIFMPQSSSPGEHSHEQPDQELPVNAQNEQGMMTGTIVTIDQEKRFGFIQPEGGKAREDNYHFRFSNITDVAPTDLKKGSRVSFYPGKNSGGLEALGVCLC